MTITLEPRAATAPAEAPTRPPLSGARGILLLGALTALPPLAIDAYLPAFPTITAEYGTGAAQTQLSLTALLVGLALGQLVLGPLSDAIGRRRPVLLGLSGFLIASLLCSVAPTIEALIGLRFLQGFAGAAAVAVSRAVVRDLHAGTEAARIFASLMLVMGVAPILAPVLGAQLLEFTSWRGVFLALAVLALALILVTARSLPETLPPEKRSSGGIQGTLRVFRRLVRDRVFVGYALSGSLAFAAMFAYVSGSPFVLQDVYGLSAQQFSGAFAANAVGLIGMSQVSRFLVRRTGPRVLLRAGLLITTVSALLLLVATYFDLSLVVVLPALWVVVASVGLIGPNSTALALADHGDSAGSASALLGLSQFLIGAAAAPLVGLTGVHSAVPLAGVMTALSAAGLACLLLTRTPPRA